MSVPATTSGNNARKDRWRTALAAALVLAGGLYATYTLTDGLQAFSLESARRLQALRSPLVIPNPQLEYADARRAPVMDAPGQILLVDFIYTRCATYCQALGSMYARLQDRLAPEINAGHVRLLSITFDPERDGPLELQQYRARYGSDAPGWDLARPLTGTDLQGVLNAFGVVVIDDGLGGFAHNAAVHIVDRNGRLAAIHDVQDVEGVVRQARALLKPVDGNDAAL